MPKDATKNVDRYKIAGGHLNEYEFHKNQEEAVSEKKKTVKPPPTRGASAKKLAARKAAKK